MDRRAKLLSQPTLTEFFLASASLRFGKIAYLEKDEKGRFTVATTYAQLMDRAYRFAAALLDEDFKSGDIVAVMSNPAVAFAVSDLGAGLIGCVTGGIYVTDSSELLEYKLNHLEARVFVIENREVNGAPQLDKVLRIPRQSLPHLKRIVVAGPCDPAMDDRIVPFDDYLGNATGMPRVSDRLYLIEPEMPCVIIYSSGTGGRPKGAVLTHHNIMSAIRQAETCSETEEGVRYMDFLPPAHVFGYMMRRSIEGLGATTYISHRDSLADDLPAVAPQIIAGVPKFYMAMAARIRERVAAMQIDIDNLEDFQKQLILRAAGLHECDIAVSGSAAIPDETVLFFKNKLGLRIDQAYGVTETSPGIAVNTRNDWKLGTVGRTIDGVSVSIFDDDLKPLGPGEQGEIAVSGENVFSGYFKDEEQTALALKKIGGRTWYLTGDLGRLDEDGYLTITDRRDDMLVPTSGENVSSTSVENKLTLHSRYVGFAVPYGTRRDHVTALVWADETKHDNIIADAEAAGMETRDVDEIQRHPEFLKLLERDLRRALDTGEFTSHERPHSFIFLTNPGEQEVTGTLKARKKAVRSKFANRLDALYESVAFLEIITQ